jgi:hypothetical protein
VDEGDLYTALRRALIANQPYGEQLELTSAARCRHAEFGREHVKMGIQPKDQAVAFRCSDGACLKELPISRIVYGDGSAPQPQKRHAIKRLPHACEKLTVRVKLKVKAFFEHRRDTQQHRLPSILRRRSSATTLDVRRDQCPPARPFAELIGRKTRQARRNARGYKSHELPFSSGMIPDLREWVTCPNMIEKTG